MNSSEKQALLCARLGLTPRRNGPRAAVRRAQLPPLCICLLIFASGAAFAQSQSSFDQDSRREYVADLKQAAFEKLADLGALEMQAQHPDATRASIYIDLPGNDINLQSLKVSLAGKVVAQYQYSAAESASLRGGSKQRVLRTTLNAQRERLVIAFTGTRMQEQRGQVPVKGAVQVMLDTRYAPMSLVVPISTAAFGKTLELSLGEAIALGQSGSPELGMAKYLRAGGNKYAAMTELLTLSRHSGPTRAIASEYYAELARNTLDFGMHEQAVANVRKALGAGADWRPLHTLALRLAELDYGRNYDSRAYQLLQFLAAQDLTQAQLLRWQNIQSRLMMSGGQFEQACEVLSSVEPDLETMTEVEDIDANLIMYLRFNFAICLLKTDETARGWQLMRRIGSTTTTTPEMLALRDRANLLLGYYFLNDSQNSPVRQAVQRIRLDSPFRAEALLVLGWMELASGSETPGKLSSNGATPGSQNESPKQKNETQQEKKPDIIQYNPFKNTELPVIQTDHAYAALAIWQEIVKDHALGQAVQEAMVATAFALSRVGQGQEARAAYQRAVDYLENSHRILTAYHHSDSPSLRDIGAGNLSGLPNAPWVTQVLADHPFQEHLQNYLELRHLQEDIQRLQSRYRQSAFGYQNDTSSQAQELRQLDKLNANLDEQITQQATLAAEVFSKALTKQIATLERYIAAARLGVAASQEWQDRQQAGPSKSAP